MKYVLTKNDIEALKEKQAVVAELIDVIESEFLALLESEELQQLPIQQACILLEPGDKVLEILEEAFSIEYIERSVVKNVEYYRIAKRNDHDFQLIYSLVGIHDEETEQWLMEKAE
ncbi:hypothetical protein M3568_18380 [Priestia flexa]|uniref:hypothetical protein n=1 Tax=Priestia flexa TaxID=86664 RepID=UPI00204130E7|nr:hypothetical protein [Priestia flexa]MCM3068291.1 hypothetical protein [Priestia flexa]